MRLWTERTQLNHRAKSQHVAVESHAKSQRNRKPNRDRDAEQRGTSLTAIGPSRRTRTAGGSLVPTLCCQNDYFAEPRTRTAGCSRTEGMGRTCQKNLEARAMHSSPCTDVCFLYWSLRLVARPWAPCYDALASRRSCRIRRNWRHRW